MKLAARILILNVGFALIGMPYFMPAATGAEPTTFPIVPLILEFEYASQYFMQWINDNPQYSLIEASVYEGDPPVTEVVLTEKSSSRRVYYLNSESRVKELTDRGLTARTAKIDFRAATNVGQQPSYGFALIGEHGQAIRWRLIPATEVSERGAGLTEQYGGAGLQLRFRERGTAAGAGSAVQIGDKVSEADPWPEISSPPYFIAHRGFYIEGMPVGLVLAGSQKWRVTSSPSELVQGAQWVLADDRGHTKQLRISARRGDEVTIAEVGSPAGSASLGMTARITTRGLALRVVTLSRGKHLMRVSFKPELELSIQADAARGEVAFQIDIDSHDKIAQGSVVPDARGEALALRWQTKSPDWAKTRAFTTTIAKGAAGYQIESR